MMTGLPLSVALWNAAPGWEWIRAIHSSPGPSPVAIWALPRSVTCTQTPGPADAL